MPPLPRVARPLKVYTAPYCSSTITILELILMSYMSTSIIGIVRMHEAYSTPSVTLVTVVLEYMDGGSLNDLIIGQMPTPENPHPQRGKTTSIFVNIIAQS